MEDIPYIDVISSIRFCGQSLKDETASKSGVSVLPNFHMYLQIIVILMLKTSSLICLVLNRHRLDRQTRLNLLRQVFKVML